MLTSTSFIDRAERELGDASLSVGGGKRHEPLVGTASNPPWDQLGFTVRHLCFRARIINSGISLTVSRYFHR